MFVGTSSQFSPLSANSRLPDFPAHPRIAPSHSPHRSQNPKLSFGSDHLNPAVLPSRDLTYDPPISANRTGISTSTKRARNSRGICTSISIGLKADQNQHLRKTPIRAGSASRSEEAERGNSPEFFRFCSGGLQAGVFGFSGAPLFVPYATKWDSVFVLQDQQNDHLRKNGRGVGRCKRPLLRTASLAYGCRSRRNRQENENGV
jgi:hypothetical protein